MIRRIDEHSGTVRDESGKATGEREGLLEELAAEATRDDRGAQEPESAEAASDAHDSAAASPASAASESREAETGDPESGEAAQADSGDADSGDADSGDAERDSLEEASVEAELGAAASDELVESLPEHQLFRDPEGEDRERLLAVLEALLFASPEPLSQARLSEIVGLGVGQVKGALEDLQGRLDAEQRPYQLVSYGPGWRLFTRRDFYPFLLRLRSIKKVEKLTPAALETLAIVAYRQPVIRADVEAIRGVKVGPMLRALMDRKLVKVLGRADVPGAPLQYGTTQRFLDRFGLGGLQDLPSLKEFQQGRI